MKYMEMIIFVIMLLVVGSVCFRKNGNIRTVFFSIWLAFTAWVNVPNFVIIPEGVELVSGIIGLPFRLYYNWGIAYTIMSNAVLAAFGIFLGIEWNESNIYTAKQVKEKFDAFSSDASELKIIGRDLDFLKKEKKSEFQEQQDVIAKLKNNCKLLCETTNQATLIELYYSLMKNGIQVRCYDDSSDEITKLRGQIKVDGHKNKKAMIITKTNDCCNNGINKVLRKGENTCYEVLNMTNGYVVEGVSQKFDESFFNGRNPLIKCIALDLGGVYLEGDIGEFYAYLNKTYGIKIKPGKRDKVNIDNDLMLGNKTIKEFIEGKMKKDSKNLLTEENWTDISNKWSTIWKPNEKIAKLVDDLIDMGYKVVPFSNLDKENGDLYVTKDYLPQKCTLRYFSYEKKKTKPNENAFKGFEYMVSKDMGGLKPYQILLIDDHDENIITAKSVGWERIKFSNANAKAFDDLLMELKELGILPGNYDFVM